MANTKKDIELWNKALKWGEMSFLRIKRALEDPTLGMEDSLKSIYEDFLFYDITKAIPFDSEYAPSIYPILLTRIEYDRLYKEHNDPNKLTKWQRITGAR